MKAMHIDQQTTGMLRHMQAGSVRILWGFEDLWLWIAVFSLRRHEPSAAESRGPSSQLSRYQKLKKPIKSQQSINAMCRIDLVDLTCLPGLTLKKDIELDIDLC